MSDLLEKRLESLVPDLRMMVKGKLMTNQEMTGIVKKYRNMEQRILRRDATRADYLRLVRHESNFLLLMDRRFERLSTKRKVRSKIRALGNRRVIHTYNRAVQRFKADRSLWLQYARHCVKSGSNRAAGKVFARGLALHPHSETLWLSAWSWELEGNGNVKSARRLAQRALRALPKSEVLWREYLRAELLYLSKMRARRVSLGIPAKDESAPDDEGRLSFWSGGVALAVLRGALKALGKDVSTAGDESGPTAENVFCEHLRLCRDAPLAPQILVDEVAKSVIEEFPRDASICEAVALRGLAESKVDSTAIRTAWDRLHGFAVDLEQPSMWARCMAFVEKYGDQLDTLPTTDKLREMALERGISLPQDEADANRKADHGILSDDTSSPEQLAEFLARWEEGAERIPSPEEVCALLEKRVFSKGSSFDDDTAVIWLGVLRRHASENDVRSGYSRILATPGAHLAVVREALEFEKEAGARAAARKLYERLVEERGSVDSDLWIDWITFEQTHGEFRRASILHWKAQKKLKDGSLTSFVKATALQH